MPSVWGTALQLESAGRRHSPTVGEVAGWRGGDRVPATQFGKPRVEPFDEETIVDTIDLRIEPKILPERDRFDSGPGNVVVGRGLRAAKSDQLFERNRPRLTGAAASSRRG